MRTNRMIRIASAALVAVLCSAWSQAQGGASTPGAVAGSEHHRMQAHVIAPPAGRVVLEQLRALYRAVARYVDAEAAEFDGYTRARGCSAGTLGAEGIAFTHAEFLSAPSPALASPPVLLYESRADGDLRFLGVEYRVPLKVWHESGHVGRPQLFGRRFAVDESQPDQPSYRLRVWIGQYNPNGVFADLNPLVACPGEHDAVADPTP